MADKDIKKTEEPENASKNMTEEALKTALATDHIPVKKKVRKRRLSGRTKGLILAVTLVLAAIFSAIVLFHKKPEPVISETLIEGSVESGPFDESYWVLPSTYTEAPSWQTEAAAEESYESDSESETPAADHFSLNCTILDVGQGSCAVLESGGEYVVIDTGDTSHAQVPVAFLKRIGVTDIKYVVNTHWDNDHCGATIGLYRNFNCGPLIGADYEADTRTYKSIREMIDGGVEFIAPVPGQEFRFGSCSVIVNGPVRYDYEEENSNSISMIVTDGYTRMYIGGDTTVESEEDIIASGADLDVDIYICNHHGSNSSTGKSFVAELTPVDTVISCGKDNDYGHPAKRVLETLQESGTSLYRTDIQGDIVITFFDGSGYRFDKEPCNDWTPGVYEPKE